jgi:hypothetical protein
MQVAVIEANVLRLVEQQLTVTLRLAGRLDIA